MSTEKKDIWYYIIVQNPGTPDEEILGYEHPETKKPFIPAFASKEISQACFMHMPKDIMKEKYEAQAIIKEDLITHAERQGHQIYLLDDKGAILKEIS